MNPWIERQRGAIDYAAATLWRRKGRNLGLLLLFAAILFLLGSAMLYSNALMGQAGGLLQDAPELLVQRKVAGRHDLTPAAYVETIAATPGVSDARGRLWGYFYDPPVKANYTVMVPASEVPAYADARIGAAIARTRGLGAGDALSLPTVHGQPLLLSVEGVLPADTELVTADLMLVDETTFRVIMDMEEELYTDVAVRVENPEALYAVAAELVDRLPDTRVVVRDELLRTYRAILDWREGVLFVLLIGALLAFLFIAWDRAAGLGGEERREIATLKALGWSSGDLLRAKAWEGVLITLSAFLLGYSAAYWHVFALGGALFEPLLRGWSSLYPDFAPTPGVDLLQLALLFLLVVLPYGAATLIPSWRAANRSCAAAME